MSGGSVPLWVTLVLAVIALLGPWGGAWLAARRDDRRWEREQAREERRWQRERGHQLDMARQDEKKRHYTDFLAALTAWGWLLDRARKLVECSTPLPEDLVAELEKAKTLAANAFAGVSIVVDADGTETIDKGFLSHMDVHHELVTLSKFREKTFRRMEDDIDWVRRQARDELGIEPFPEPA